MRDWREILRNRNRDEHDRLPEPIVEQGATILLQLLVRAGLYIGATLEEVDAHLQALTSTVSGVADANGPAPARHS